MNFKRAAPDEYWGALSLLCVHLIINIESIAIEPLRDYILSISG